MPRLYTLPPFLADRVTKDQYERWLHRKAAAHVKRDRKRKAHSIMGAGSEGLRRHVAHPPSPLAM
ncbi:MAG: hypothetical protein V4574_04605 [Pseudomonadota bacterium]